MALAVLNCKKSVEGKESKKVKKAKANAKAKAYKL